MARIPPSMGLYPTGFCEAGVKDDDSGTRKPKKRSARANRKSILERFDKMATMHINEHRQMGRSLGDLSSDDDLEEARRASAPHGRRPLRSLSKTLSSSMSNGDIIDEVDGRYDNELAEAVNKLIRAEEKSKFTEMMIAAEAAVAAAPPELAEEAALAVTRDFHNVKITPIREEIRGDTLIEVVGYLGVRKRKTNKREKTKFCGC